MSSSCIPDKCINLSVGGGRREGGGTDGGRERKEEERCSFSKYTTTNLAAETPRLLGNCRQKHCRVCPEQPPLPFVSLTAGSVWKPGYSPAGS